MSQASEIRFRKLTREDAAALSELLTPASAEYSAHFHPFDFDVSSLEKVLEKALCDQFIGLEIVREGKAELAGFYMLRGIDEGFANPMYGVFIASKYSARGLGGLSLAHAEAVCKLSGREQLLLKVHPKNSNAKALYERRGFSFIRVDQENKNLVLGKRLTTSR